MEAEVAELAEVLLAHSVAGKILRVLVERQRRPGNPYTDEQLEMLLLLSLALGRAGMWP